MRNLDVLWIVEEDGPVNPIGKIMIHWGNMKFEKIIKLERDLSRGRKKIKDITSMIEMKENIEEDPTLMRIEKI